MHKPSVLVIDDDPACLKMISARALDEEKYRVFTATGCKEGLITAAAVRPDCVLIDYHLLDGTAADFCKDIRANDELRTTPIIVMSADHTREIEAHEDCQADGFIPKVSSPDKYDAVVHGLLRRVAWDLGLIEKGDLRLEPSTRTVFKDGKPAALLSPERFRLFALLVEKSRRFVPEEEIRGAVMERPSESAKSNAVKMLVSRLRQDLGLLGRRIRNTRNKGWIYLQPKSSAKTAPGPASTSVQV